MSDIVPHAVERLEPHLQMRLSVVQQAREEDVARVKDSYARAKVAAEVAPFFTDLPARIAASHLVVSRSGASTVAELAAIGRPAILVPLPHALDQDQSANARRAGAGRRCAPPAPGRLHARPARRRDQHACQRAAKARSNGRGGAFPRAPPTPPSGSPTWSCGVAAPACSVPSAYVHGCADIRHAEEGTQQ
jgi:UDP-N-acetylglucosamine--N-acetylmuramyl-(pentapeptide) pyrophosphoryl-undecaprenol N-acetylglucosamine transferase